MPEKELPERRMIRRVRNSPFLNEKTVESVRSLNGEGLTPVMERIQNTVNAKNASFLREGGRRGKPSNGAVRRSSQMGKKLSEKSEKKFETRVTPLGGKNLRVRWGETFSYQKEEGGVTHLSIETKEKNISKHQRSNIEYLPERGGEALFAREKKKLGEGDEIN